MAEFEESLYMSQLSQDIIHIIIEQQQKEIETEEEIDGFRELTIGHHHNKCIVEQPPDNSAMEFTSELDKHIYYTGLEMYYIRRDDEKRMDEKLEAVAQKWEMWGRAEPQPEPEPEPELEPLTELINVEQILNELLMLEKEAGFVGLGREELCS